MSFPVELKSTKTNPYERTHLSISNTIRIAFDIQDENIIFEENCARVSTKKSHTCTFLKGILTYTATHCDRYRVENGDYTIIKNDTKTSTLVMPSGGKTAEAFSVKDIARDYAITVQREIN